MDCAAVIQGVTRANAMFEVAVVASAGGIIQTAACKLCRAFLAVREADVVDTDNLDEQQEQYRAGQLLLILAAMRLESEETIEALRILGTYGVDARNRDVQVRYARAGRDRKQPVRGASSFKKRHRDRVERSLTNSLHELTRQRDPTICREALEQYGDEAIRKYLGGLR